MSKEKTGGKQKHSALAAAAYFLFFLPLLTNAKKDAFVQYHVRQGAGFFITAASLRGILAALAGPPYTPFGALLSNVLLQPAHLVLIILLGFGLWNVFNGDMKPLPVIGKYAENLW